VRAVSHNHLPWKVFKTNIKFNFYSLINSQELSMDELDYIQVLLSNNPKITLGVLIDLGIQTQYYLDFDNQVENPMELKVDYYLIYKEIENQINHLYSLLEMEKKDIIEIIEFYQPK
jgi:hypothetical protein